MQLPFSFPWQEAKAWLEQQPTHNKYHVHQAEQRNFRGYTCEQVVKTPGLLDLFNEPEILKVAHQWLGTLPVLYSLNAWWSLVAEEPEGTWNQFWHRDTDDSRFLVLFLFLTDVDENSGGTQIDRNGIHTLCGPAGSLFFVDTTNLHRGLVPKTHDRLIVWARYGYGANSNSADKEMRPVAASEVPTKMAGTYAERQTNRLLVEW